MLRQRAPKPSSSTSRPSSSPNMPSRPRDAPRLPTSSALETPDDPRAPLLGTAKASDHGSFSERRPNLPSYNTSPSHVPEDAEEMDLQNMSRKSQWIILAVASGACAAFNGVFAKLTTTELTTSFATGIANLVGLSKAEKGVEVVVRAVFFGLNLIFNGIMWALFTKALARGTSTTQVSILNTSSNFMITALLGLLIFSESLPPLWFLGAGLLVAGNVIIGRREEGEDKTSAAEAESRAEGGEGGYSSDEERGVLLGDSMELDEELERKRRQEEEDILQLGSDVEEEHDERLA